MNLNMVGLVVVIPRTIFHYSQSTIEVGALVDGACGLASHDSHLLS